MSKINQQIITLEEKIAYQEQTVEVLSERLYKQQKEIAQFKKKLEELLNYLESGNRISDSKVSENSMDPQEIPPHY